MNKSVSDIQVNNRLTITKRHHLSIPATVIERPAIVRMLLVFWVLRLFKPEWIISYYFPAFSFLKSIPTIFLIFFCAYLIFSRIKIQYDRSILFYLLVVLLSTFFSENRGISYGVLRGVAETFIVSSTFLSFYNSEKGIKKLFAIYAIALVCFGIWGIAEGGLIKAMLPLENEDSFGPFMAVGFVLTYFIHYAQNRISKTKLYLATSGLALIGAIVSFARGTFVSLVLATAFIFVKSSEKIRMVARFLILGFLGLFIAYVAFPNAMTNYVKEVSTIWEQGAKEETANHRLYLWLKAWDMFVDHPLLGVGPGCYGFRISMYESALERERWGVDRQPYGRAIHNIYFEILSELGLFGLVAFLFLIYSFVKKTAYAAGFFSQCEGSGNRCRPESPQDPTLGGLQYYGLGLLGGMAVFLVNAFFFNLLIFTYFWDLLILNSLIYRRAVETQSVC
jgi:O-antigen ligase